MIYLGKKLKTFVTFDFVNIRSSRRYFAYRGPGTSFILKESPIGVSDQIIRSDVNLTDWHMVYCGVLK